MSLAAHAALAAAFVLALGHGHHDTPVESLTRLVWVEPAPPPALPLGGGGSAPSDPQPAPAVVPSKPAAAPDAIEPRLTTKPAPTKPRPAVTRAAAPQPIAPAPAPPAPDVAAVVPPGPGTAAGVTGGTGDTVAGTADGVAGGVVGGLGDRPLPLAAVASPPELLDRVTPEYPRRARALEIEGQVVLEVVLDRSGRIEPDVKVIRSVAQLDEAAVAAVRQWRFRPARDRDGRTVRVVMEIPVRFVLR